MSISPSACASPSLPGPDWSVSPGLTDYDDALAAMEVRAGAVRTARSAELIWLLEHPPIYTAGTSAAPEELLDRRYPVVVAGRGGRYTYHGPGQRVVYAVLDLSRRGRDVRRYVDALEGWAIAALARLGITSWRAAGRVGIWTHDHGREAKIGAIGVRVKRWVTMHGMAINVAPDLSAFGGIVPCGLGDYPVTSVRALGKNATMNDLDRALADTLPGFLAALRGEGEKPLEGGTLVS